MQGITLSFHSAVVMLQLHCCIQTGQKHRWYEKLEGNPEKKMRIGGLDPCVFLRVGQEKLKVLFVQIRMKLDLKIIKYVTGYCKTKGFFMSAEDRTVRISCRKTMLDLSQNPMRKSRTCKSDLKQVTAALFLLAFIQF